MSTLRAGGGDESGEQKMPRKEKRVKKALEIHKLMTCKRNYIQKPQEKI